MHLAFPAGLGSAANAPAAVVSPPTTTAHAPVHPVCAAVPPTISGPRARAAVAHSCSRAFAAANECSGTCLATMSGRSTLLVPDAAPQTSPARYSHGVAVDA